MRLDGLDGTSELFAAEPHSDADVSAHALLLFIVLLHQCNVTREMAEVLRNFSSLALDGDLARGNSRSSTFGDQQPVFSQHSPHAYVFFINNNCSHS